MYFKTMELKIGLVLFDREKEIFICFHDNIILCKKNIANGHSLNTKISKKDEIINP